MKAAEGTSAAFFVRNCIDDRMGGMIMKKLLKFLSGEFSGWKLWEVFYLVSCTAAIAGISFYLGDTLLGIASAITGTLYTLLAGKGKISCYFFGIFNSASYGYIAFEQKLYGDAALNWCWYLPMMFAGIVFWRKKMDQEQCVIKNYLPGVQRIILTLSCICGIAAMAAVLAYFGDKQPVIDASTTVLSIAAMYLTVRRCVEQWLLWILVNGISVFMWLRVYLAEGNSIATLLWWMIMLITGIIFLIQWQRDLKNQLISRKSGA